MNRDDKELANKEYEYRVARYKDDLKTLDNTVWPVSVVLIIMFMGCFYFVPQLLDNSQWFLLSTFILLGFVFYKVFEALEKYKLLLKQTISDLEVAKRLRDSDRK